VAANTIPKTGRRKRKAETTRKPAVVVVSPLSFLLSFFTMTLLSTLAQMLTDQNATLSTAESCTGGLIGHLLTNVPGSSNWYQGGVVSYSNELKMQVLGVKAVTLDRVGAVSEQVAEQMAIGARQAFHTTYAVSVTGIAGPGGSTADKPVGLTYIGVATPALVVVRRYVWQGSREGNKQSSATAALELLHNVLTGATLTQTPAMKSTVVEVRLGEGGSMTPTAFVWQGRTFKITDWGRQKEEGNVLTFLVMTARSKAWELEFDRTSSIWTARELNKGGQLA
jgi:PncC family amidohydrolase